MVQMDVKQVIMIKTVLKYGLGVSKTIFGGLEISTSKTIKVSYYGCQVVFRCVEQKAIG